VFSEGILYPTLAPMKRARTALASVAAVSSVVFTMTHFGANPVAPGADLGITVAVNDTRNSIDVESDVGDISALLRLTVAPPSSDVYTAQLTNGTSLEVTAIANPGGRVLTIHKPGGIPTEKFDWPSGVNVRVIRTPTPGVVTSVSVTNWEIFEKAGQSDTKSKAERRSGWYWVTSVLAAIACVAAVATPKEGGKGPQGARECVAELIEEIEVGEDTLHVRTILRKRVIEHASYQEALAATGLPPARARALSIRALSYFSDRLEQLIVDLIRISEELQERPDEAGTNE
jgi:hypothetical protein